MVEGPETSEGSNVDIDHVFACFVLNLTKRKEKHFFGSVIPIYDTPQYPSAALPGPSTACLCMLQVLGSAAWNVGGCGSHLGAIAAVAGAVWVTAYIGRGRPIPCNDQWCRKGQNNRLVLALLGGSAS